MSIKFNPNRVSMLLNYAYLLALSRHSELHAEYAQLQHRLPIPSEYSAVNAQNLGHLDFVLRCMEDERAQDLVEHGTPNQPLDLSLGILSAWSEAWIIGLYEMLRSAKEYCRDTMNMDLFRDVEKIRIPLAKYQIAKDNKLVEPLRFSREGANSRLDRITIYDKADPQRNHTMPRRLSARGSLEWCAIDVSNEEYEQWLERRQISDRFLQYLRDLPKNKT